MKRFRNVLQRLYNDLETLGRVRNDFETICNDFQTILYDFETVSKDWDTILNINVCESQDNCATNPTSNLLDLTL